MLWEKDAERVGFESLTKSRSTEVLIIGGGIAGILCSYALKKAGVDCLVAEADKICKGISEKTTAKITLCHGLIYQKLIKVYGENSARLYLKAQMEAMAEYDKLCREIDCDYQKKNSFVYSTSDRRKIVNEIEALNRLGVKAELSGAEKIPVELAGAVCVRDQAQLHPLKFAFSIAKDLPIYENTKVQEIKGNIAVTPGGEIRFKKLIVATHFPIFNKHGGYFLKLYQHRSYVIALQGAQNVEGMYVDENDKGMSFRNHGELLLLGGGGHRTGKRGGCWQELESFAREHYEGARIISKWATQDCMTLDSVPYIGLYSRNTPDTYVATGFNKWGMTNAMAAARILCDMITGKENPYARLFSPSRSVLHPQLAANIFESTMGLIKPTVPRCPHLGCALKYNRAEHTWDCPCHGSRFTENGELIDNPATDDKRM